MESHPRLKYLQHLKRKKMGKKKCRVCLLTIFKSSFLFYGKKMFRNQRNKTTFVLKNKK